MKKIILYYTGGGFKKEKPTIQSKLNVGLSSLFDDDFMYGSKYRFYLRDKLNKINYRLSLQVNACMTIEEIRAVRDALTLCCNCSSTPSRGFLRANGREFFSSVKIFVSNVRIEDDLNEIDEHRASGHALFPRGTGRDRVIFRCATQSIKEFHKLDALLGELVSIGLTCGAKVDFEQGDYCFYGIWQAGHSAPRMTRNGEACSIYHSMRSPRPLTEDEKAISFRRALRINELSERLRKE